MDVYFEYDQEVIHFCEYLFQRNKEITLQWKVNKKWGNHINITTDDGKDENILAIVDSFIYVFVTHRLGKLTKKIIQENYYYSDKHEIEHIHNLSEWIVVSAGEEVIIPRKRENPMELLRSIFSEAIQKGEHIHFDSIIQFGMKFFDQELIEYVGIAIDEFKREEEYQSLIHSLREYVAKKSPNFSSVHVLEANPFSYYNQAGKQITKNKLDYWLKKEPLYLFGLSTDEQNLAPLIAMMPEEINLYTEDPSSPKIQTITNVFQEKVFLHSLYDFPFYDDIFSSR